MRPDPICRVTGNAESRYLFWFGLEGHNDLDALAPFIAGLGFCPMQNSEIFFPFAGTGTRLVY
jgi:hypothetical protein